ncbi:hypothetical protein ACMFMG_005589 [Clarireedia jacksonii]
MVVGETRPEYLNLQHNQSLLIQKNDRQIAQEKVKLGITKKGNASALDEINLTVFPALDCDNASILTLVGSSSKAVDCALGDK